MGVGTFGAAGGSVDEEPDLAVFEELEYAAAYTEELHLAFAIGRV